MRRFVYIALGMFLGFLIGSSVTTGGRARGEPAVETITIDRPAVATDPPASRALERDVTTLWVGGGPQNESAWKITFKTSDGRRISYPAVTTAPSP